MSSFTFYFSTRFNFDSIEGFHLLQDHIGTSYSLPWNDYDYVVTFQVYRISEGRRDFFGRTKILVNGFQDTSQYFKTGDVVTDGSTNISSLLDPSKVVSLASDIEYYRRLRKELGNQASQFLAAICDASYYYGQSSQFTKWPGFSSSLFRDGVGKALLKKGHQVAKGSYTPEKRFTLEVSGLEDNFDAVKFYFDNSRELGSTNINLLIGKNGSGKSHILRKISDQLTGISQLADSSPYFHKVVVAAYSPFESFKTESQVYDALSPPSTEETGHAMGNSEMDSQARMERRRLLVNEYAYIGFKNPDGKFSLDWPKESSAYALIKILAYDRENIWWGADSRFKLLFDTLRQSIDFDALALVSVDGRHTEFALEDIEARKNFDSETAKIKHSHGIQFLKNNSNGVSSSVSLSSGQTIYSYLLPCLVAEVDDESLLILDEPELYLHPAMEVGLINMLKKLLTATKSNSIIASHSSILAREVERKGIFVLRREDQGTTVSNPTFETFGQSIEMIMGETFDDYDAKKAYENSLDAVLKKYDSPKSALNALADHVGDEALVYLASKVDEGEIVLVDRPEGSPDLRPSGGGEKQV